MSYKSRFAITEIQEGLDISLDYDMDENKKYPVFLFTPDIDNTDDHYHIILSYKEARILHNWLEQYIDDYRDVFIKKKK